MKTNIDNLPVLAVIGAGASGLSAAIWAARTAKEQNKRIRIILFEAFASAGKKLLATGNGRCNLSNADVSDNNYFGDKAFFNEVFKQFNNFDTVSFFDSIGVLTVTDDAGRIYPKSLRSESVLSALLFECERLKIEIITDTKITSVKKDELGFILNGEYAAKSVIMAGGGLSSPSKGAYGSLTELLKNEGIDFSKLAPSLTAVIVKDFHKGLKGVRAGGRVKLFINEKSIASEIGEVQYTDYGLSGIAVMQLSAYIARLNKNDSAYLQIDSVPDMSFFELKEHFDKTKKFSPEMPVRLFLSGLIPDKLGKFFISEAGLLPDTLLCKINKKQSGELLGCLKAKSYVVSGLKGFEHAQVTSGGIKSKELTPGLELKKLKGIYTCGEIIDIDGFCGGYNLQWAWSSGYVAGRNCVLEKF